MSSTTQQTSSASTATSKTLSPREVRFIVCVLFMVFTAVLLLILQLFLQARIPGLSLLAQLAVLVIGPLLYEWTWVHSRALSRTRRAYFDEVNVLETYQPRARTHGHLFQPDPPTPGPNPGGQSSNAGVSFSSDTAEPAGSATFNAARDAHYANEYEKALKMAREMESAGSAAAAAANDAAPQTQPVAVELSDEKKKKKKKGSAEGIFL